MRASTAVRQLSAPPRGRTDPAMVTTSTGVEVGLSAPCDKRLSAHWTARPLMPRQMPVRRAEERSARGATAPGHTSSRERHDDRHTGAAQARASTALEGLSRQVGAVARGRRNLRRVEHSVLQGLSAFRWAAWFWMTTVVVVARRDLARPWLAMNHEPLWVSWRLQPLRGLGDVPSSKGRKVPGRGPRASGADGLRAPARVPVARPATAEAVHFIDDGSPHEAQVNAVATAGIAIGDGRGSYGPQRLVTRAQMAAFLVRHLAMLQEAGKIIPPFWGDLRHGRHGSAARPAAVDRWEVGVPDLPAREVP